ncbi:MAG: response regulator [Pseudomonadota bacterium]
MTDATILVVDDDPQIRTLVKKLLEKNYMRVKLARDVTEAQATLEHETPDLIVLDLMMPGEDGTSFCRRLRQDSSIPILMLSALGDDIDRIIGLETGADDYLAKPFNPRELVARIRSILRRASSASEKTETTKIQRFVFEDFQFQPEARRLFRQNDEISLTSGEFTLLQILVEHAPRVLSRDQLLELSRGINASSFDRSIDSHISRLRGKIENNPRRPELIKTIRNLGYVFAAPVEKVKA